MRRIIRSLAFFGKEIKEIVRQPSVLLTLVLGPFLILLLFGVGTQNVQKPVWITMVVPPNGAYAQEAENFARGLPSNAHLKEVTSDEEAAMADLRAGRTDVVTVVPGDLMEKLANGRQAVIKVYYQETSPIDDNYLRFLAYSEVSILNRHLVVRAIEQGRMQAEWAGVLEMAAAGDAAGMGGPGSNQQASELAQAAAKAPPSVLAEPFATDPQNIAVVKPDFVSFYTPAVIALLLQHIAITFMALSLVRERSLGTVELFRVSPASSGEILLGKYLSVGTITLVVGGILTYLANRFLGVPFVGSVPLFALTALTLTLASLGIGLIISLISGSEKQAVQLTMLVLIASIFFSGFFMPAYTLTAPVRAFSHLFPATLGLSSFQDIMLRGATTNYLPAVALAVMGLILAFFAWWIFKRQLR